MHKRFAVSLDGWTLTFNPPLIHISVAESARARPETRARLGPPLLYRGIRADHLTIPLEPMRSGRLRGRLNVHLTWQGGEHRHTLAAIDPAALDGPLDRFVDAWITAFAAMFRSVTPEELEAEGYAIVRPDVDALARLNAYLDNPPKFRRLRGREIEGQLADLAVLDTPANLREQASPDGAFGAVRVAGGVETMLWVRYMPQGFLGAPPGWFAFLHDEQVVETAMRLLEECCGTGFLRVILIAARELEAEIALDRMEHVVAELDERRTG